MDGAGLGSRSLPPAVRRVEAFGNTLRYVRRHQRVTQATLARQLGLSSQAYVNNLEAGRKTPSSELVLRIADLFGVGTDYLLRDSVPVGEGDQN